MRTFRTKEEERTMMTRARWLVSLGLASLLALTCLAPIGEALAGESPSLAYFRQAKINWRQAEGQKLTIGLNNTPTRSPSFL